MRHRRRRSMPKRMRVARRLVAPFWVLSQIGEHRLISYILQYHSFCENGLIGRISFILQFSQLTNMKGSNYLSQFQKEQYTQYLQGQLQKFSSFMLTQRKENERFRKIDETLADNNQSIQKIKQKVELLEIYQHQSLQTCQQMSKKILKVDQFENRIVRVEERCRVVPLSQAKSPQQAQKIVKEYDNKLSKLEKAHNELTKQLRQIQSQLQRNKDFLISFCKSKSPNKVEQNVQSVSHKDLKRLQKKMQKFFNQKFEDIQSILMKSQRKRSKSPSFRTPIEFINSNSSVENTQKILTQFKINDHSSYKSDISTISRQTKPSGQESSCERSEYIKFKKSKKEKEGKSKSKSKKSLDRSRSKSKANKEKSKSKSPISKSKSPQAKPVFNRHKLYEKPIDYSEQNSKSKSRRSSLSCKKQKSKDRNKADKFQRKKCRESCFTKS